MFYALSAGHCQVSALCLVEREEGSQLYIGTTWGVVIVTEADQVRLTKDSVSRRSLAYFVVETDDCFSNSFGRHPCDCAGELSETSGDLPGIVEEVLGGRWSEREQEVAGSGQLRCVLGRLGGVKLQVERDCRAQIP